MKLRPGERESLESDDSFEVDGVPMPRVPDHLLVTWEEFWREHTRQGHPQAPALLRQHSTCGGRLTLVIESSRPVLLVACTTCTAVLTAIKLDRGGQ